jgi:hypothetical protein
MILDFRSARAPTRVARGARRSPLAARGLPSAAPRAAAVAPRALPPAAAAAEPPGSPADRRSVRGGPPLLQAPAELALAVLELWAALDAWHAGRRVDDADAEPEALVADLERRWQAGRDG